MEDKLICESINSKGYGIIPKLVMQDRDIHAISKCIYAYFCSYAGAGNSCFPTRSKICYDLGISTDTFVKYLKQLIEHGYLKREQIKENGRFSHNVYTLCSTISPCPKISDTEITVYDKLDTNNNSINNNNIINNNSKQINEEKENYKEKENEFYLQKNISISTKKRNEKNQEYELIELKRVKEKVEHVTENVPLKNKILSFLNFRIKNKKLVTMEYLRVFLEKLDKLSNSNDNEKIEILNQSIERGYTTIYAVRKSGNSSFYRNNNIDEPESYNVDEYEKLTSNECYLDNMMNLL